ncbi:MAG: tellurite resistance TerB family protein [Pirellulaceae bacterium]
MDFKSIFDQLLQSGQQLARQGKQMAEKGLGVPESGPERDQMLSNLGKGAAAGGALALLLGTRWGRRITGPLLKIGGLAAVGALGYTAYKNWQQKNGAEDPQTRPLDQLDSDAQNQRSELLLKAMISAANADGHIDDTERAAIENQFGRLELSSEHHDYLTRALNAPATAEQIAAQVSSLAEASEVYVTSLLVIDVDNEAERQYLKRLSQAMNMPDDLVKQIEDEANA